jgi:hypothetical protein
VNSECVNHCEGVFCNHLEEEGKEITGWVEVDGFARGPQRGQFTVA